MPIVAATSGTLSTIAESKPIEITTRLMLPIFSSIKEASSASCPVDWSAEIAMRIPRKNKTLGISIFLSA
jgi:hypothetical protein